MPSPDQKQDGHKGNRGQQVRPGQYSSSEEICWIEACNEYQQHFASDKATVSNFVRANNLPQTFNKFMCVGVAGWHHPDAKVKITKVAAEGLHGVCWAP